MSNEEIGLWFDLMAEAPDLEWAYYDVVDSQPLVLLEMACRGAESNPSVRRNINPSCSVQDLFARAYVRGQLASRGRFLAERREG